MLTDAGQAFNLLLLIGAGTGGLFILRWFWWRISAWTELIAMVGSVLVAGYFTFVHDHLHWVELADYEKLLWGTLLTTSIWIVGTLLTPAESDATLQSFVSKVRPGGPGWKRWSDDFPGEAWSVPMGMLSMILGSVGGRNEKSDQRKEEPRFTSMICNWNRVFTR